MKTWHFTIRGPPESDYEKGLYHGIIELAKDYPINPPNLYFLTVYNKKNNKEILKKKFA
jgi:ubiquitin-conjugating enzyme E2 J1